MIVNVTCTNFEQTVRKIYLDKENTKTGMTLGDGSYLVQATLEFGNTNCHVLVGKYCSIAHRIKFIAGLNHDSSRVSTYPFQEAFHGIEGNTVNDYSRANHLQIVIGNDVWIGADVMILGGVKIGNGAVIGAGAVVAKDIPPYAVVVGNPAKVVKYRFDADTIDWLQNLRWWNWPPEKIRQNWQDMKNISGFRNKYHADYPQRPGKSCQELMDLIKQSKKLGYKFYYLVPDVMSSEKIWQNVLNKFINMPDNNLLFIDMPADISEDIQAQFIQIVNTYQKEQLIVNQPFTGYEASCILPFMDYVFTTKEAKCSAVADMAAVSNFKILYGMDEWDV